MRLFPRAVLMLCSVLASSNAQSAIIGFEFDASAFTSSTTPPSPFGFSLTNFNPVHGRFVFDTNSAAEAVVGCPNCAMYRQNYPQGFSATFNSLEVSADEFVVIVSDDFRSGTSGPYFDIINIRWVSNLATPLKPLTVNGTSQSAGLFSINLSGATTIFSGTSLPSTLNLASFTNRFSFLADTATGAIDVPYNITSLSQIEIAQAVLMVPEPQTWYLTGAGCISFIAFRRRRF